VKKARPLSAMMFLAIAFYLTAASPRTGGNLPRTNETTHEYAARGGQISGGYEFSGGDDIGEVAWYIDNSNLRTHEVEAKHGNELGVYDMSGNVWEWCEDLYHLNYEGAPTDGSAWLDADSANQPRVVRGGSWYDFAEDCRVTSRDGLNPANWNYVVGFRVVRDPK
jgi:formylglycine-generating enzyme required for sulfatase activity